MMATLSTQMVAHLTVKLLKKGGHALMLTKTSVYVMQCVVTTNSYHHKRIVTMVHWSMEMAAQPVVFRKPVGHVQALSSTQQPV